MANFQITETTRTERSIPRLSKEIILEAGQKLSDDTDILAIAQKTVPAGYRITVNVDIIAVKIEKL